MTLVDAPTAPQAKPKRQRHSDTFEDLMREFGVETIPKNVTKHKPRQTHTGARLRRLHNGHGPDHLRDVLTVIVESEGNEAALISPVITAVSDLLLTHGAWWRESASTWLEVFDGIDLLALHAAVRPNLASVPASQAIASHLHLELVAAFGEARPWRRSEIVVPPPVVRSAQCRHRLSEMMVEALCAADLDADGRPHRFQDGLHGATRRALQQRGLLEAGGSRILTAEGVAVAEELLVARGAAECHHVSSN